MSPEPTKFALRLHEIEWGSTKQNAAPTEFYLNRRGANSRRQRLQVRNS